MNVAIKSANLRGYLFLTYKYILTVEDTKTTATLSSDAPIHDDLKNAFRNLLPFFVHICEEVSDEDLITAAIKEPEAYLERTEDEEADKENPFLKFRVTGFEIGGKTDYEGVYLTGEKTLKSHESINIKTPLIHFQGEYAFAGDLSEAIENAKRETFEYSQGKQAARVTSASYGLGLDEEDGDANEM